jgi:shikimate kinase
MKIFLIGFMGSGKSHWGGLLSQKLSIPFFDLDAKIRGAEGRSINDIFAQEGEEYFRMKEKEVMHILTESHDSFIMATGGGTPCYFNNIEYMNNSGTTVWLNTSIKVLCDRLIKERDARPLVRELTDEQLRGFIIKKMADRRMYYEQAKVIVEEENVSPEQFIEKVFHA